MSILSLLVAGTTILVDALVSGAGCWRDSNCSYGPSGPSFSGLWDKYNYSPENRTVSPVSIYSTSFDEISSFPLTSPVSLSGNGSMVIFDFGKEVGGII